MCDLSKATAQDLVKIRDLIVDDPVALQKWGRIVDQVIPSPVDVRRIKDLLRDHYDDQAVLETLQIWRGELLHVLYSHGLNRLADKIRAEHPLGYGITSGLWFEVGEVPHTFVGRNRELELIHAKLTGSHSQESTMANVVCITGPAGIGKSTVAQKCAFKNCKFYEGNAVRIKANSMDSARASYDRIAEELGIEKGETMVTRIYRHFSNKKCLFIFDNLEDIEVFNQFKPTITNPAHATPYVLLTSRKSLAPIPRNNVHLGPLEVDDAVMLMTGQGIEAGLATRAMKVLPPNPMALLESAQLLSKVELPEDRATWVDFLVENGKVNVEDLEEFKQLFVLLACLDPNQISEDVVFGMLASDKMKMHLTALRRCGCVTMGSDSKLQLDPVLQRALSVIVSRLDRFSAEWLGKVFKMVTDWLGSHFARKEWTSTTKECITHGVHFFELQLKRDDLWEEEGLDVYFHALCYFLTHECNFDQALAIADKSSAVFDRRFGPNSTRKIRMQYTKAYTLSYMVNRSAEALEILESISVTQGKRLSLSIRALKARILGQMRKCSKALKILKTVIPEAVALYGKDHREVLEYEQWKGFILCFAKRWGEAITILKEVYEKQLKGCGRNDLATANSLEWVGYIYEYKGLYKEALDAYKEAYEEYRRLLGEAHPRTAYARKQNWGGRPNFF